MKKILLTGGAGYIGSHTCVELLAAGYEVVIYDNLSNSSRGVVERIETISGRAVIFEEGDVRNAERLRAVMDAHGCSAVIHLAGLKAVGESTQIPLVYYDNNVSGTMILLQVMQELEIKHLVFSSSATVYGDPQYLPLDESHPLSAANPYGRSKLMAEQILADVHAADPQWCITVLRYFNPVGAHPSGLIGEDPHGIPNNLMPFVTQVAVRRRERLSVWGDDYDTADGTGVRDYIHVVDLGSGHVRALQTSKRPAFRAINLGTGKGYSVLEVVRAFQAASGQSIPYEVCARRPGDIPACYANPALAEKELGWHAKFDLNDMCKDSWGWQSKNPQGYK
ncbi:UDP-glucose 4-epimerase GalE [Pseudomonas putida]|uniref:UDP-glucose 4-epimerase GalE n=1 Tax=Pseudomonas putida TaxID=303 RepID=UPI0039057731